MKFTTGQKVRIKSTDLEAFYATPGTNGWHQVVDPFGVARYFHEKNLEAVCDDDFAALRAENERLKTENADLAEGIRQLALRVADKNAPRSSGPRVWGFDDPEPDGVLKVEDVDGDIWALGDDGRWHISEGSSGCDWEDLVLVNGPLTEVVE